MNWIFNDWCEIGDELLFFHSQKLYPGKYNKQINKISYFPEMDIPEVQKVGSIEKMFEDGNRVFLLPVSGDGIVSVDINNYQAQMFSLGDNQKPWGNYAFSCVWNEALYVFFRSKDEVFILYDALADAHVKKICLPQKTHLGCQINNIVWLFPEKGEKYICFNLLDNTYVEKRLDISLTKLISIDSDGENIYLFDEKVGISILEAENSKIIKTITVNGNFMISSTRNKIVLLPFINDEILLIDKNSGMVTQYTDYPDGFTYNAPKEWAKYTGYKRIESKKYYALRSASHILIVDEEKDSVEWIKPKETTAEEDYIFTINKNGIVSEELFPLNNFLEFILK